MAKLGFVALGVAALLAIKPLAFASEYHCSPNVDALTCNQVKDALKLADKILSDPHYFEKLKPDPDPVKAEREYERAQVAEGKRLSPECRYEGMWHSQFEYHAFVFKAWLRDYNSCKFSEDRQSRKKGAS